MYSVSSWLLLLLCLHLTFLSNGLITNSILKNNRARVQTVLYGIGSDVLERPEDENSPEFRDYLKNLMKMQANRAIGGFAAPSSGSSDAYVAKLNRLKIERQALREAGFPDAELDTSYKEEDFKAAVYESQEPLVSSTVLTGDAAIPGRKKAGGKTRPLSHEEIVAKEAAERAVEEALKRNPPTLGQQVAKSDVEENPYARLLKERAGEKNEDEVAIDNILEKALNKKQSPPAVKQQQQQPLQPQRYAPPPNRPPVPVPIATPAAPVAAAVPLRPAPAVPLRPVAPTAPVAAAVPLRPVAPPAPPAAARQPTAAVPLRPLPPTPVVPPSTVEAGKGKKMSSEDLEIAAEALKLLVKHRGGGPFGVGRLRTGAEVSSLEGSLRETVSVLRSLDSSNAAVAVAKPTPVVSQAQAPSAPAPVPKVQTTTPPPVAVQQQQQQRTQMPAAPLATVADASAPVPIALGLDQFLQAPVAKSDEELGALRDGLIQVLAMIQSELAGRSLPSGSSSQASQVPDAAAAAAANMAARDRIMKLNAPASATQTQDGSIPVEQDIKQAMGLLLKHRGGPGFGHGRLEGKELDWMAEKLRSVSQRLVAEASA